MRLHRLQTPTKVREHGHVPAAPHGRHEFVGLRIQLRIERRELRLEPRLPLRVRTRLQRLELWGQKWCTASSSECARSRGGRRRLATATEKPPFAPRAEPQPLWQPQLEEALEGP